MTPSRSSTPRPETMTWGKAMPTLSLCAVFDAMRFVFEQFWFFGPMIAGAGAAAATSGVVGTGTIGSAVAGGVGAATAGVVGFFGGPALVFFGVVMAMAVGLLGWLTTGLLLLLKNGRIFKENASAALTSLVGLGVSELPFLGSLPALSITTWKLYHTQIKYEKKRLKEWEQAQTEQAAQERSDQMMEDLLESRAAYAAAEESDERAAEQEADEMADAEEAKQAEEQQASEEIPEEMRDAA